jgi:DnaJ-class molecular chaperone
MGIFKKNANDDATKPLPVEEAQADSSLDVQTENEAETPVENVEDRSEYNCEACKGEGLVLSGFNKQELCPKCAGTGRVN